MQTTSDCHKIAHHFEACVLRAYPDPGSKTGDPWTIGWGHTGPDVYKGLVWTQTQADAAFIKDIGRFEIDVNTLLGWRVVPQNHFDALVDFAYNVGSDIDADSIAEGLGDSTLLKKYLAGDIAGAANEFLKWNGHFELK